MPTMIQDSITDVLFNYGVRAGTILVVVFIGLFVIRIVNSRVSSTLKARGLAQITIGLITRAVRLSVWLVVLIMALDTLGVQVGAILAGLGVGGLVVGLALQDTIRNLIAGLLITQRKPFQIGHWINIEGNVGGVADVGLLNCALDGFDGTKIVIPNSRVWNAIILNYTANPTRTIFNLTVSISYSDDISKAMDTINEVLAGCPTAFKEPPPRVVVVNLNDSSVDIAVRPTVNNADYWDTFFYLNKEIKEALERNGITIPFPQRVVHMQPA